MDKIAVLEVSREVFFVILKTGGPIMAAGLIIGLAIAVFQTLTSIQEMTLTFVPKIIIIIWRGNCIYALHDDYAILEFTRSLYDRIAALS